MTNTKHGRLQELDRSDFEIVKGEPDIRGWDVRNTNRQKIGEVEELIVDVQEKKVRYLVVDLDDNELKLDHRKVLIPIGLAELDRKDDDVLIPQVSPQQYGELPVYDRNNLTGDVERRIFSTLERRTPPTMEPPTSPQPTSTVQQPEKATQKTKPAGRKEKDEVDPDFYGHEYYNVDNLYKNRLHEAESVKSKNESEYDRGLRLWERRSEGGILPGDRAANAGTAGENKYRELDEEERMEIIRNRRDNYRQRRYSDVNPTQDTNKDISERTERSADENLSDR